MRMPVTQFLRRRLAGAQHLDVEGQIDARQRMIRIQQHLVAVDRDHGYGRRKLILPGLELVPHRQLALYGQLAALHRLHLFGIAFAVGLGRRHQHSRLQTRRRAVQLLVEPVDDLPRTFEIRDGSRTHRGIEHPARGIAKRVMK